LDILNLIKDGAINNKFVQVVLIAIILDTVLGVIRALKERKFNSSAGIDGAIRKITMVICLFFLLVIDSITDFNLIGFIPEGVREVIKIEKIGITEFFAILYVLYEAVSILKNMALCGLPLPKKFREWILKFLNEMTDEVHEGDDESDKTSKITA